MEETTTQTTEFSPAPRTPPLIFQRLATVIRELGVVPKGRQHEQGWPFRSVDDVKGAVAPVLARQGVFVVPSVLERDRTLIEPTGKKAFYLHTITVNFLFFAEDGSNVGATVAAEAAGYGDEGLMKAHSKALRCALEQVLMIPDEEKAPKPTSAQYFARAEALGVERTEAAKILNRFNKERDQMIPLAMAELERFAAGHTPKNATEKAPIITTEKPPAPPTTATTGVATATTKADPATSEARSAAREAFIEQIKRQAQSAGLATDRSSWANFEVGLVGKGKALTTLPGKAFEAAYLAVAKAASTAELVVWASAKWLVGTSERKAYALGLIVAHHHLEGIIKTKTIVGDPTKWRSPERMETTITNLLSWTRPEELADQAATAEAA